MWRSRGLLAMIAVAAAGFVVGNGACAQTPEQQQMWDAQRAQALADQKVKEQRLAQEREARKKDPMGWVKTLNPIAAGGWEFRAVANDGSWATFSTNHQMKRSGSQVTVWLREEYAEPQTGNSGRFLSAVQKVQYDCSKQRARTLLAVFYAENNIQGSEQSEEADLKTVAWNSIVPGTRDEFNFNWACSASK